MLRCHHIAAAATHPPLVQQQPGGVARSRVIDPQRLDQPRGGQFEIDQPAPYRLAPLRLEQEQLVVGRLRRLVEPREIPPQDRNSRPRRAILRSHLPRAAQHLGRPPLNGGDHAAQSPCRADGQDDEAGERDDGNCYEKRQKLQRQAGRRQFEEQADIGHYHRDQTHADRARASGMKQKADEDERQETTVAGRPTAMQQRRPDRGPCRRKHQREQSPLALAQRRLAGQERRHHAERDAAREFSHRPPAKSRRDHGDDGGQEHRQRSASREHEPHETRIGGSQPVAQSKGSRSHERGALCQRASSHVQHRRQHTSVVVPRHPGRA